MGANITTLADTLVVAMLQPTPDAAQVVLAEAIGVTIVSLLILGVLLQARAALVLRLDDYLVASNVRLALFVGTLFLMPHRAARDGILLRERERRGPPEARRRLRP